MAIARRIRRNIGSRSASLGLGHLAVQAMVYRARERALARCAGRQHGVIAAWQLLELGFTRGQIAARVAQGRLHQLHAGVYAVGHRAVTREGRWMAAVLAAGRPAVLSHRDAAALWEIADFTGPEIEVTLPGLGSRIRPGIRTHRTRRLLDTERTRVRGIPVTSVERTMLDLAGAISPRHLRGAYLEAQRRGILDIERLNRAQCECGPRRGLRHLRRLISEDTSLLVRARSPLEERFLNFCRKEGLPEPLVNVWLHGYLVDAYWPAASLVVELDGYEYHRGRGAFERDRAKIGDLRLAGIEVLPVTHRRLRDEPQRVADVIRKATSAPASRK